MQSVENKVYLSRDGKINVNVRFENEMAWLSIDQMSTLFGRNKSTISRHIKNIFKEGELQEQATVARFATVQAEGQREVERNIEYYNLDVITSVGYRVKSRQGRRFRIWATQQLCERIITEFLLDTERSRTRFSRYDFQRLLDRIYGRIFYQPKVDYNLSDGGRNEVRGLKYAQLGQIRTARGVSGEPFFCFADVCYVLGLSDPSNVKTRLPKRGIFTNYIPTYNQHGALVMQEMDFIDEPNLCRCICQSLKEEVGLIQDSIIA